jgi:hypothetical protein
MLHEITGRDWSVKLSLNDALSRRPSPSPERSQDEDFKDDPVIQEAIELFKAQVKS